MKRFTAASEFEVLVEITLHRVAVRRGGIIEFTIKGLSDTHLPTLCIEAHTCHVLGMVAIGRFSHEIRSPCPIKVGVSTLVGLRIFDNELTLAVGAEWTSVPCTDIYLPGDGCSEIRAFLCGPDSHAADATVDLVEYRWRPEVKKGGAANQEDTHQVHFDLPDTERDLLEKLLADEKEQAKWQRFDSVFGVALVFNSLWIGVAVAYEVPAATNSFVENTFLWIFLTELFLRFVITGRIMYMQHVRGWMWKFFLDPWCMFDTFIIMLTMFDLWIAGSVELPFPVGVLRLLRLLKLVKMVRLVRAFKSLSILVEGMVHSAQTVMWTFALLFIAVFVWGCLLAKVWEFSPSLGGVESDASLHETGLLQSHADFEANFSCLSAVIWQLVRMSTFGDWGAAVRTAAFAEDAVIGMFMTVGLISFMAFGALGILNMLIGVMCLTAFRIETQNRRQKGAKHLVVQQAAVRKLRTKFKTYGKRPLFTSDLYISFPELFHAINDDDISDAVECLGLKKTDFCDLGMVFEEEGQIEIDGLIEAVIILELQRYFETISLGQALSPNFAPVRSMDMLFFAFATKAVEKNLRTTEQQSFGNCSLAYDAVRCLHERSRQANTILPEPKKGANSIYGTWEPPVEQLHEPPFTESTPVDVKQMFKVVHLCNMGLAMSEISTPVDLLFGLVICLNSIFLGIQMTYGANDSPHYMLIFIVDNAFTVLFTVEFIMRSVLYANFQDLSRVCQVDLEDKKSKKRSKLAASNTVMMDNEWMKVQDLQLRMKWGIFVPMPLGGWKACVAAIPPMLTEPWLFLDFVIISTCLADALVISQLRNAGATSMDPSLLTILRILRVCRLAKVLRVFRVFPKLQMLVFALKATARTIFWTLVMVFMGLYVFAMFMFTMVGRLEVNLKMDGGDASEHLINYFGTLPGSLLSGWQLVTFDEWNVIMAYIFEHPLHNWKCILPIGVMVLFGCGVLKLAVGIMCESAVNLVKVWAADHQREDLVYFFRHMADLKDMMMAKTGSYILTHKMLEDSLDIKFRIPYARDEEVDEKFPFESAGAERVFLAEMRDLFIAACLSSDDVKLVFELLDYERWGRLHIDQFIAGALELKEDIEKLTIFTMGPLLHRVIYACRKVSREAEFLHWKMDALLEEFAALIHRVDYAPPVKSHHRRGTATFTPKAQAAIELLQSWNGHGPIPAVSRLGRLDMLGATGTLSTDGELITGYGTRFRQEVKPGDMVVVEREEGTGRSLVLKSDAIVIGSVVSQTVMKAQAHHGPHKHHIPQIKEPSRFKVSRKSLNDDPGNRYAANVHDSGLSHFEINPPEDVTPRTGQHLFEWELHTKKCAARQVSDVLSDHKTLTHEMLDLEQELQAIMIATIKLHSFRAWCAAVDWTSLFDKRSIRPHETGGVPPIRPHELGVGELLSQEHVASLEKHGGLARPEVQQVSSLGRAASKFLER